MRRIQGKKLSAMVSFAYNRSKFWRSWFDNARITPSEIRVLEDLQRLPTCSKKDLLSHSVEDRLTVSQKDCVRISTSGTTGEPMPVYLDRSVARNYKIWGSTRFRYRYWAQGIEPMFSRTLQIVYARAPNPMTGTGERSPVTRAQKKEDGDPHRIRNQILGNAKSAMLGSAASHIFNHYVRIAFVSHDISETIPTILDYKADLIEGPISYLRLLAEYASENKVSGPIRPARFLTVGEAVDEPNRTYIESVFRTNVYQGYGCNEVGLVSCECARKKGMHVVADEVILEILDDEGNPVPSGENGNIVATGLVNRAMPLIRYKLGDVGRMSREGPCSCGITLPILESVEGRAAHYMYFPNGRQISPKGMLTMMHNVAGLPRCQVVQDAPDSVLVRVFAQGRPFPQSSVDEFTSVLGREAGSLVRVSVAIEPTQRLAVKFSASVPFSQAQWYRV